MPRLLATFFIVLTKPGAPLKETGFVLAFHRLRSLRADVDSICRVVLQRYSLGVSDVVICLDSDHVARYLILEPSP